MATIKARAVQMQFFSSISPFAITNKEFQGSWGGVVSDALWGPPLLFIFYFCRKPDSRNLVSVF
jgi:hypothetical protein